MTRSLQVQELSGNVFGHACILLAAQLGLISKFALVRGWSQTENLAGVGSAVPFAPSAPTPAGAARLKL